jgi:hypothetical protein
LLILNKIFPKKNSLDLIILIKFEEIFSKIIIKLN